MLDTSAILQEICSCAPPEKTIWIAYSGGLDSSCLLHILAGSATKSKIKVIHVNHRLSRSAEAWQNHCENQAQKYDIPIVVESVEVNSTQKGVERAAREARYQVFEKHVDTGDILLMGHHLNDMSETLLYRILRGSGLRGLAGIHRQRSLGAGNILRPLLDYSREQIEKYALEANLNWVEDDSNRDERYDRNFIRHQVIPVIEQRWPQVFKKVGQTAQLLAESEALLTNYAQEDLQRLGLKPERIGQSIDLNYFCQLDIARQRHIIRAWVNGMGFSLPDAAHLEQLPRIIDAAQDKCPVLEWGACALRRYQQRLYLLPRKTVGDTPASHVSWCVSDPYIVLPWGGRLGIQNWVTENIQLKVTQRIAGVRCQPQGRNASQTLKKLLQEYKLEPWLRDEIPLIWYGDELVAVGDLWKCDLDGKLDVELINALASSHFSWKPGGDQDINDD